jgi:hypothetical protein
MERFLPIPLACVVISLSGALCSAQSGVPVSSRQKPSAAVPQASSTLPSVQPTAGPDAAVAVERPHSLEVGYEDGKLSVDATNASLNQILREVSKKTGITVRGGVRDERVFGHYGPASPADILASLLEGTGSNMLLVDDPKGASELVLTARLGGATPPNPNATFDDLDNSGQSIQDLRSRFPPPSRQFRPPTAIPSSADAQAPAGDAPPVAPPTEVPAEAPSADPPPTNGARTPQQIYDQLQNLLQQKQQVTQPQ